MIWFSQMFLSSYKAKHSVKVFLRLFFPATRLGQASYANLHSSGDRGGSEEPIAQHPARIAVAIAIAQHPVGIARHPVAKHPREIAEHPVRT